MIKQGLAFLGLFGCGLGLLFWLDSREQRPTHVASEGQSEGLAPPTIAGTAPGLTMVPRGRFQLVQYAGDGAASAGRSIEFTAANSGPGEGQRILLDELTIRMFDPKTGELVVDINAESGSTLLNQPGRDVREMSLSSAVELSGVSVKLLRGSRLVPLELTAATLSGDLALGRFETPGRAKIVGSGISAEGDGLILDESLGLISFSANANTVVRAEGGQPGRLACVGPLTIRQQPADGPRPVQIEASQRALLAVEGDTGLSLEARDISIAGRVEESAAPDSGGGFRFEKLQANGEVELRAAGHVFRTESADFELTPAGALKLAELRGSPYGRLSLPDDAPAEVTAGQAGDGQVEVWGQGPMIVTWAESASFQVAGPAELRWRGASLWAAGGLAAKPPGSSTGSQAATTFSAWTGVVLDFEGWNVRTDNLTGRLFETGERGRLELESSGHSQVSGRTSGGGDLNLLAREGFDFEFDGQRWLVPEARLVDFNLAGGERLSGRAARLFDFDAEARSFRASGDVEVQSGEDYLTGESVEVLGLEDFTLIGRAADADRAALPVRFDSRLGSIVAMQLERRLDALEARGAVMARFDSPDFKLDLDCEALSLSGRGLLRMVQAGEQVEHWNSPILLLARGSVHAAANSTQRTFSIDAASLRLLRTALLESREFRSDLQARTAVDASFRDTLGHYKLLAAEFDATFYDPFEQPEEASREDWETEGRGNLAARGDVRLEKIDSPPLTGRGDRFELDENRLGRLSAREGAQVETAGYLPGTGEPFTLRAKEFSYQGERLVALEPRIVIVGKEGREFENRGAFALKELQADAKKLVAVPESVTFTDEVAFVAHTPEGERWTLNAGLARFDHTSAADAQAGAFDRLVAESRVRVLFSAGPNITGDYLTANTLTGMVRIDGTPATAYTQMLVSAQYFELDTRNFQLRMGPGYAASRTKETPAPVEPPPAPPAGFEGEGEQRQDAGPRKPQR
jgi:hypothetical protein